MQVDPRTAHRLRQQLAEHAQRHHLDRNAFLLAQQALENSLPMSTRDPTMHEDALAAVKMALVRSGGSGSLDEMLGSLRDHLGSILGPPGPPPPPKTPFSPLRGMLGCLAVICVLGVGIALVFWAVSFMLQDPWNFLWALAALGAITVVFMIVAAFEVAKKRRNHPTNR